MSKYQLEDLLILMRYLRDPDNGCPWDRQQTLNTIVPHTIEEAYEVADAIERNDMEGLRLELGDLLFQVVFYAQLTDEAGQFDFQEIVSALVEKLLRRHPHVFPDGSLESFGQGPVNINEADIKQTWENIKHIERREKDETSSVLADIPTTLPALTRAYKIQKRAAQAGFDWDHIDGVIEKLYEEMLELKSAIKLADQEAIAEETGDLLFSCVNLARHLNLDAESELRNANKKFSRRFQHIEQSLARQNQAMQDTAKEHLEKMWQQSKKSDF